MERKEENGGAGILPDKYVFLTDEYQWSVQSQKLFLESCNITTIKFPYAYHLRWYGQLS